MRYGVMLSIAYVMLLASPVLARPKTDFDARYTELHDVEQIAMRLSGPRRDALISEKYYELFHDFMEPNALRKIKTQDLQTLFKAASMTAFYIADRLYADDLSDVVSELERRNVATDTQRVKLFHVLVQLRDFTKARSLLGKHPDLEVEALPAIPLDFNSVGKIAFDSSAEEGNYRLESVSFDIFSGSHLVIVAHPLCQFSRNAVDALEADASFASMFSSQTIWLAPVDGRLHLKQIREWNVLHPQAHIIQARHESDWPMITEWATPQFYALRDGRVIGHVAGWPKEGSKQELLVLLEKLVQTKQDRGL